MNNKTKKLTVLSLAVTVAMLLSYIEFLLPPIFSAVPGIKIGLANIITVFLLYRLSALEASLVSLVRVCLSSLLFGSLVTLTYSIFGAIFSMLVMVILKKLNLFSTVGVSISGAVFHNVGQIVAAIILLGTKELGYYMIVLTVTGVLAGIFVGIAGALMLKHIKRL